MRAVGCVAKFSNVEGRVGQAKRGIRGIKGRTQGGEGCVREANNNEEYRGKDGL